MKWKEFGSKGPLWHDAVEVGLVLTLLCLDYRYIRGEEICADVFTFEFDINIHYVVGAFCIVNMVTTPIYHIIWLVFDFWFP